MRDTSEVKLGLVQMRMGGEGNENVEKAVNMIGQAARKGADIVCLPELFSSSYFPQAKSTRFQAEPIPGPTSRALATAAADARVVVVGGSIFERSGGRFYNTSVIFDERGNTLGKYRKVHIPFDSHYYERAYFSSGGGYGVFQTKFGKLGVLICFDQWYPEPARICRLMGAQILFYPTAIGWVKGVEPAEGNWQEAWETVQRGHAISNSLIVCAVNRVGVEEEMTFWGGSFVSDQFGKVLFRAGKSECVSVVPCSLSLGKEVEDGWGFLRHRRPSTYKGLLK